jgi:hypothetical protein
MRVNSGEMYMSKQAETTLDNLIRDINNLILINSINKYELLKELDEYDICT